MHELEKNKDELASGPSRLGVLFTEMIQMCLWGNATVLTLLSPYSFTDREAQDLSLLTHMTEEDIRNLQTVEKGAQEARSKFILKDDQAAVWEHVKGLKDARVDFVLDNCEIRLSNPLINSE